MKKKAKKSAKKVAPKKVAPKKAPAVKKVTPKKEVAKPAAKKVTVAKKATATKPTTKSSHRKQRGRTAPNRALSVTTKETATNKKTVPVKWNKIGPKKLPFVKSQLVKKNEPSVPAVQFAEQEAELFDLTKPVAKPVAFAPAAVIKQPTFTAIQPTVTCVQPCKPACESAAQPCSSTSPAAISTWTVPTINTVGVSTCTSTEGWHTVVSSRSL